MTMKKQDRKGAYVKIINLMIAGNDKGAFDGMRNLCGEDTGLFILCSYEDARKEFEEKKAKQVAG